MPLMVRYVCIWVTVSFRNVQRPLHFAMFSEKSEFWINKVQVGGSRYKVSSWMFLGLALGQRCRAAPASCWVTKSVGFISGAEGASSFILEADIAVGIALEEKSFEILIFNVRKIVTVLVL